MDNKKIALIGIVVFFIIGFAYSQYNANKKTASLPATARENSENGLPKGYTLDNYKIEKILEVQCQTDGGCQTPAEYLTRSNCPYTSICLHNKCTVVCPSF